MLSQPPAKGVEHLVLRRLTLSLRLILNQLLTHLHFKKKNSQCPPLPWNGGELLCQADATQTATRNTTPDGRARRSLQPVVVAE